MAANNYFGFSHGGTQYGTNNATYQTTQTGYSVTASIPTQSYATHRPATSYDNTYQAPTTHTNPASYSVGTGSTVVPSTYDYGYGRTTQPTYDTTKTYYQQQQPTSQPATSYTTPETHYQAAPKPTFNTTISYTQSTRQVTPPAKLNNYSAPYSTQDVTATNYSSSYTPATQNVQTTNITKVLPSNTDYSNYDTSVYNTSPIYATPQTTTPCTINKTPNTWKNYKNGPVTTSGTGMKQTKQKQPPKSQQLHYCDVCKISCAGPQTYREHLDGQKHKKKESAQKAGSAPVSRGGNALRCELCDVTCTGNDAYSAHIRGAKHQKVLKLHTKLGKPIPSTDPVLLGNNTQNSNLAECTTIKTIVGSAIKTVSTNSSIIESVPAVKKTISNVPKVNFISAGSLGTVNLTGNNSSEIKKEASSNSTIKEENNFLENETIVEKDVQPVGQNYIEEIKNEEGKVVTFNCKLCECRFNDPNAKEMHMKGRRHRLQYKKKVDPELVVDVKPSLRQRKLQEEKLRRQQIRDEYWRRRDEERIMEEEERMYWEERRRYEEEYEYEWYRRYGRDPRTIHTPRPFGPPGVPPLMFFPQSVVRRPDSSDDRHVIARHAEIYPKEEELQAVQKIVSHTEKALKFVSDHLTDTATSQNDSAKTSSLPTSAISTQSNSTNSSDLNIKQEMKKETDTRNQTKDENKKEDGRDGQLFSFQRTKDDHFPRILKGVMRVGMLAKGLLLHGDRNVNLVVLCGEKPTRTLLNRIADNLPKQLKMVAPDEQYEVKRNIDEASILVTGLNESNITVTITLTSPIMREQILSSSGNQNSSTASSDILGDSENVSHSTLKEPVDVLDKQKCLDALAALRHAKWFQARATGLQSCVMVIRILRDLCHRVPTWSPLESWAMELLVEKVISSAGQPLTSGDALRRIMESLASGILFEGGPGIHDPCEKDPTDPTSNLTPQQREDITASAQHALRLIVFRQIHKVLGMESLPPLKFTRGRFNRKRRRDNSTEEGNDSEAGDGKKDKKEDEETLKMEIEKEK